MGPSCNQEYTPKPRGYFRIELPKKEYHRFIPEGCPFSFDIPAYAEVLPDTSPYAESCWMNIEFKKFKAEINLSYKPVKGNLNKFIEDSRTLVYKHSVKADAIDEKRIGNPEHRVYGLLYDIGGNSASAVQFYVTDSSSHFVRGALYFYVPPEPDSLEPVINFLETDIRQFITSLKWEK